jgi:hypothetical protein
VLNTGDAGAVEGSMKWQRGPGQQQYTLTIGALEARVWYQPAGEWAALITQNRVAVSHNFFRNLMDAQLWCEARLTEMKNEQQR